VGVVKKMAKNTASLSTAKVISLACSVVFSIFAARYLGELQYGTYAFIMVLITYFMVTSEYGLENLLVRDVADNKEKAIEYIASTLAIKILTSLLSLAMLIVVLLIMKRQDIVAVSFWAGLSLIPYALYMAIDAAFRAHEEMHYIAIIDIIYFVMRSAIGILVVINTTDLTQLFRAFLVVEVLRLVLGVIIYRNNVGRLSVKVNVSLFKYLIKDGFSMAYWKMLAILYKKVDMLILSVMIGDIAVGWFKIARNITDMITIGSVIIMNVLMPVMTVMYANSKIDFKDAYNTIFKYIVIVMIPVAVLIANYSDKIILSLYGELVSEFGIYPSTPDDGCGYRFPACAYRHNTHYYRQVQTCGKNIDFHRGCKDNPQHCSHQKLWLYRSMLCCHHSQCHEHDHLHSGRLCHYR